MIPAHPHATFYAVERGDAFNWRRFVGVGGGGGAIDVETRSGSDVIFRDARIPRLPGRTVMRVQPLTKQIGEWKPDVNISLHSLSRSIDIYLAIKMSQSYLNF